MNFLKQIKVKDSIFYLFHLSVFVILIAEIYLYPGVIQKYLKISISSLLIIDLIFVLIRQIKYNLISSLLVSTLFFLTLITFVYLNIQEQTHFSNYVYSTYQVSIYSVQNLMIFLMFHVSGLFISSKRKISDFLDIFTNNNTKHRNFILIAAAIIFGLFLLRNNFNIQWSIIDDHEIAYFLGPDKKLELSEIPTMLKETEVGKFGISTRYRPSYYVLRLIETNFWGEHLTLWYSARFLFLVFFLFVLSYIVSHYFGTAIGIAVNLYVMTSTYWHNIWTILGPSEIYLTLGLSFYSLAFFNIVVKNNRKLLNWTALLFGGLIATGSKENMVILAIPSIYLIFRECLLEKLNWRIIFPAIHFIFSLLVTTAVVIAIGRSGHDIYANEIGVSSLVDSIFNSIQKTIDELKIAEIILSFVLIAFLKKINFSELKKQLVSNISAVSLAIYLIFIYLTQVVYYSAYSWPTLTRYDFPGIIAMQLFWLVAYYVFVKFLNVVISVKHSYNTSMLNYALFSILLILSLGYGYNRLITTSQNNVYKSKIFTDNLYLLAQYSERNNYFPIIIKTRNHWDYEPAFSIKRYIKFMNISNSVVIDYKDEMVDKKTGIDKKLSSELIIVSNQDFIENSDVLSNLNKSPDKCILILLPFSEDEDKCELKVKFNL